MHVVRRVQFSDATRSLEFTFGLVFHFISIWVPNKEYKFNARQILSGKFFLKAWYVGLYIFKQFEPPLVKTFIVSYPLPSRSVVACYSFLASRPIKESPQRRTGLAGIQTTLIFTRRHDRVAARRSDSINDYFISNFLPTAECQGNNLINLLAPRHEHWREVTAAYPYPSTGWLPRDSNARIDYLRHSRFLRIEQIMF